MMTRERIIWFNWNRVECISVPTREVAMKRLLALFFIVGAFCFGAWPADKAITFAQAGGGDAAALQVDTSLQLALKKKDAKAGGALLDPSFTWTGKRTGHAGTFFARIWVKRPAGWLLLTHQDTAILTKGSPTQQGAAAG